MASQNVSEVTDQTFNAEVAQSKGVTLVDFWAPWCGPCRQLGPIIDSIADEYAGKVKIMKMNVDDHQDVPSKFSIKGIPTMIIFKDGQMVEQIVGLAAKEAIVKSLLKHS